MLFSYITAHKIITRYTLYQLMYGLHPIMPIEYIILITSGNEKNSILMRVLTSKITELEKLHEAKM
jgi:hypothetical protein